MTRTLDQNKRIWKLVSNFATATVYGHGAPCPYTVAKERMHDICEEISGQRSSSQLTVDQAGELINRLQGIIRTARKTNPKSEIRNPKSDSEALATNPQLDTLNKLFLDVGMDTDARQMGFYKRVIKSTFPVTRGEVAKIHEALEAMYVRQFTATDIDNMLAAALRVIDSTDSVPEGTTPRRESETMLTAWEKGFINNLCHQMNTNKFRKLSSMKLKKLKEIWEKVAIVP